MKLKLTTHFQDMMQYRGINIDHVKAAMKEPDEEEETFAGRIKVRKQVNERKIEVVYCKEGFRDKKDEYLIITAYYINI